MHTHPFELTQVNNEFQLPNGFLPCNDPIKNLPAELSVWDEVAYELPKIISHPNLRNTLNNLPEFNVDALHSHEATERAMMVLSYLGHAYVWCDKNNVATVLPRVISQPWYHIATQLGRPPVLSYASYALYNWYRIDPCQPVALGNIALLQNFMGGVDEEWFILIHVDIEAKAIPALNSLQPLQEAVLNHNPTSASEHLITIAASLSAMCDTLDRMLEHCDPYIYYHRVRPYIHGWHNNPALPQGLLYEGVTAYQDQPQQFKGETGAQSSIIPCLDAVLNISHKDSPLKRHLEEMKIYMPPPHQALLAHLSRHPHYATSLTTLLKSSIIKPLYNNCIEQMNRFRQTHYRYAAQYINSQQQHSLANPVEIGTGGTPFMPYLKKHQLETEEKQVTTE